jgi:sulfatase modifying factor 1
MGASHCLFLFALFIPAISPCRGDSSPSEGTLEVAVPNGRPVNKATVTGTIFRECADCPEMMVIAPGKFTMTRKSARDGRKDDDPEGVPKSRASREVVIGEAFALGIYPVTRQEFGAYARETHRVTEKGCHVQRDGVWMFEARNDWEHPGFLQTRRDPVTCVNWNDALGYIQWLNAKRRSREKDGPNALPYRLPTWEEAEYAARGGTTTSYYWGEQPRRDKANYGIERCLPCGPKREGADRWLYTSPVGSFPPNPFGLYDMVGNAWQWIQRCQPDPNAHPSKECRSQALYGGSWLTNPEYLRTGEYSSADIWHRNNEIGFRVARTLN